MLEAGKMDRNKDLSDFDIGQILQTNCQSISETGCSWSGQQW